jgi:plasmid stabilization system protein ParE
MRYTVLWTPTAERRLTEIWLAAPDRREVTAAAARLDNLLRKDAHTCGESRSGDVRVTFELPLGIDFEVLEADRIVYVLTVWRTDGRKPAS